VIFCYKEFITIAGEDVMPRCRSCTAEIAANAKPCPYCGEAEPFAASSAAPPEAAPQAAAPEVKTEGPLQPKAAVQSGFGRETKTFACTGCGATISYDTTLKTLACAYCGSTYAIENEQQAADERPSRVIPFDFNRDKAESLFREWLGKGWFRPGDLTSKSALSEIRGVYLPFWAFDADADSAWSADAGYHYQEQEAYTEKDAQGKSVTKYRTVTKTRWQPASGDHRAHYEDWLVPATRGLDPDFVGRIYPFQTEKAQSYNSDYLAGFAAENPSIKAAEAQPTAARELNKEEEKACSQQVPGDTQRNLRVATRLNNWSYDQIMLPIWISAYRYKDKLYRFLVNGQTGEVQGSAPTSWLKVAVAILIAAGLIGAAVALIAIFGQK